MRFASPIWLWALFLIPVLILFFFFDEKKRDQDLTAFLGKKLRSTLIPGFDFRLRTWKTVSWTLSLFFLIVALARPQWGTREESVNVQGLDVVIAFDVSRSMEVSDVVPDRLRKSKHLVRKLAEQLKGDRLGLVAFAGSSYVACPLTSDMDYFLDSLDILSSDSIQNQGTSVALGLETALRALERGALNEGDLPSEVAEEAQPDRIILLISDGEDHEADAMTQAKAILKEGIKLFVLGVGTEAGGPVPLFGVDGGVRGFKKSSRGDPVISRFQPDFLKELAEVAKGSYWDVSDQENEVYEILDQMGALSRQNYGERTHTVHEDRFQIPLFFSVVFLFLELFVPIANRNKETNSPLFSQLRLRQEDKNSTSPEKSVILSGFVLALIALRAPSADAGSSLLNPSSSWDAYIQNRKGLKKFEQGDLEAAQKNFGSAQAHDPEQFELDFNQGVVQLEQGEPEKAIQSFQRSLEKGKKKSEDRLRAESLYNLGQAYAKKGEFSSAVQSYLQSIQEASRTKNEDLEKKARKNLQLLEKQRQKQQQQQQNEDQDQAQSNSDDENQKNEQSDSQNKPKRYSRGDQDKKFESEKLTPEDVERVMSELSHREKNLQEKLQTRHGKQRKTAKDW